MQSSPAERRSCRGNEAVETGSPIAPSHVVGYAQLRRHEVRGRALDWERGAAEMAADWRRRAFATETINRSRVERAVAALYCRAGRAVPSFCWNDGLRVTRGDVECRTGRKLGAPIECFATKYLCELLMPLRHGDPRLWAPGVDGKAMGFALAQARAAWERQTHSLGQRLKDLRDFLRWEMTLNTNAARDDPQRPAMAFPFHFGSMESPELGLVEIFQKELGAVFAPAYSEALLPWLELSKTAFWWMPYDGVCVVSERPEIFETDGGGFLHSTNGPALKLRDGSLFHALHGALVRPALIRNPRRVPVREILETTNVEAQRVLIERYGLSRFLRNAGAILANRDECGTLYQIPVDANPRNDRRFVMVANATIEADGSQKEYLLSVPPSMRTARQAVAWTFRLRERNYAPAFEA